MAPGAARFELVTGAAGERRLVLSGDWTIWTVAEVDARLRALAGEAGVEAVDVGGLAAVDTSGAFVIDRTLRRAGAATLRIEGEHPIARRLIETVRRASPDAPPQPPHRPSVIALLERAGRGSAEAGRELLGILSFVGETMATLGRLAVRPNRIRWTSVVAVMEEVGLDALPIVCFLSFFIGLVIAFIGASLLAQFNAALFTVELVGMGMLREFGVVLTAILLAGRTDSAFAAQIGSMKMRQEIDAMRVIGLDPMEVLVAPRVLALLVMTPLLTFAATVSGIAGGLLAAWGAMDISPAMFVTRFQETVPAQHFWTGIVKAPVFALVVALVGCRQGLLVESDVQSLGRRTTSAVVQSIFLVIALDAAFAVLYYLIDV